MARERKPINQNLTIPNALSVLRILIIPFFAWYFLHDQLGIAVVLLVLSGLSDCVDGLIARKLNQVTELGKMLDPFADKLTQGVVALCLAVKFPVILTGRRADRIVIRLIRLNDDSAGTPGAPGAPGRLA